MWYEESVSVMQLPNGLNSLWESRFKNVLKPYVRKTRRIENYVMPKQDVRRI